MTHEEALDIRDRVTDWFLRGYKTGVEIAQKNLATIGVEEAFDKKSFVNLCMASFDNIHHDMYTVGVLTAIEDVLQNCQEYGIFN